jgi:hypothetical protein
MEGQRNLRLALLIGAVAPGYEYARFLAEGVYFGAWYGQLGGFFIIKALAGGLALGASLVAFWFLGYPAVQVVTRLVRWICAEHVPADAWDGVTHRCLRRLPVAAGLGALTWLVYSLGEFGGWPGDVVFGVIGNLIGAGCYLPLLIGWSRIYQKAREAELTPGPFRQ